MGNTREASIRLTEVLADPLLREHLPAHVDRELLTRQMEDPTLRGIDLDQLAEMDMEELLTSSLTHSIAIEEMERRLREGQDEEEASADRKQETAGELERICISVDGLGVEAKIVLHEPKEGEAAPDEKEIREALRCHGIVSGIKEEFIVRLAERPVYDRRFKIAQGQLPVDGEDGRVIFHFETDFDLSPSIDSNGIADYKELGYARNVKEGDLLCEIFYPTQGKDGFSVFGERIPGKPGKPIDIVSGANTVMTEDKTKILAACDGQVRLRGKRVTVSRVLAVDRVDASTGNILFVGTVYVREDICDGFTVRAGGDIVVGGTAEGATLVAGNNIILCGGMKGKGAGLLDAGGSIRAYFIENARVRVKNHLYADVLLNCNVQCAKKVSLSGRNGNLLGGECTAGLEVRAINIGNNANIATSVRLTGRDIGEESSRLLLQISKYQETVQRLLQMAEMSVGSATEPSVLQIVLLRIAYTKLRLERRILQLQDQLAGKDDEMSKEGGVVVARGLLYPNVTVEIEGTAHKNAVARKNCAVAKTGNKLYFFSAKRS